MNKYALQKVINNFIIVQLAQPPVICRDYCLWVMMSKDGVVHLVHAVAAKAAQIADGAVHIALAQSVGGIHHTVVIGQLGTDKGTV